MAQQQSIMRRSQVEMRTGLTRSTIYRRMSDGKFPRPVVIGDGRAVGWLSDEIEAFIEQCIVHRDRNSTEAA